MNNSLWISVCIFIILSGMIFFGANNVSAQTGTHINGIINSDTTWTQEGNPYILTGNVQVNSGVKLTIEAGTVVNLSSYKIQVDGLLNARGNSNQAINFNGGQIIFSQSSNSWNEKTRIGCIIENSVLNTTTLEISSSVKLYNNMLVNSSTSQEIIHVNVGSPIISNNTIIAPEAYILILCGGSAIIVNNSLVGGSYGIQLYDTFSYAWNRGTVTVANNTFNSLFNINNHCIGTIIVEKNLISQLYVGIDNQAIIQNNTIINGIYLQTNKSTIIYNNILHNNTSNSVYDNTYGMVNATYNWWGTSDPNTIEQTIRNYNSTTFVFTPFLTSPNPQAPLIPTNISYPTASPTVPEFTIGFALTTLLMITLFVIVFKKGIKADFSLVN